MDSLIRNRPSIVLAESVIKFSTRRRDPNPSRMTWVRCNHPPLISCRCRPLARWLAD
jgi:hypothetical protein